MNIKETTVPTITIRKLTPDLAQDYVHFFDVTPHDNFVDEHKCYCVCWCNDDYAGKDFSTAEKRRQCALQYVKDGNLQGYLAYCGDEVVGWCNANTKLDCLKCASWQLFMDYVPVEQAKVKSIFCFTIAPHMQRKGIATMLLERACQDARADGFEYAETYPHADWQSSAFGGHVEMYRKAGFTVYAETEKGLVMRKELT
ncbi:MAG: GNAT family N-acetyltransferase [Oscillospiraceae bacterium]|nr:GNAT family N-acetyltransferase [Oscillospiraceae bacterium]